MQNLTLKDIAKKLDLSISTVSKALKDYPDVKWTTKKKVLNYTEKVNFKPNAQASYLRTQKTKIIGVEPTGAASMHESLKNNKLRFS